MTKAEVRAQFAALFAEWRRLPEQVGLDEQELHFHRFHSWLRDAYPDATRFRSTMGASAALEQWFDIATHQTWRN